ncbi:MAG: LLM class F420-dependent oxidoreductase, partial [Candidatus Eremiobacterota bacterium]
PPEMDMLEGYTTLGFLAGVTRTIQLGTLVTGVTYRHPGPLIKTVTTLDVLSGGRAWLGIGAGWFEREHTGLGVPFPSTAERFERLEETLQIARAMWSGQVQSYQGKHYRLAETLCIPAPLSRPHPPIMIGGMGEKKTLRLVARYAQACNLFEHYGLKALAGALEVLKGHCQAEGRDYREIEKTVLGGLSLTRDGGGKSRSPQQLVEHLHRLAELGIDHVILSPYQPDDRAQMELLAQEVIPRVRAIVVP